MGDCADGYSIDVRFSYLMEPKDFVDVDIGLVEGGVVKKPCDAEGAKVLAAPVRLWSDRLVVRLETRDMQADGRVKVEQEGRLATGDRATYTERDQTIIVSGNVRMREADGSWLRADKVIIAIADETFEATGNVETEFTLTRGK